jgi:thiol-disulfide isomerase/thioredoxin
MFTNKDIEDFSLSNSVAILKFTADWCDSCKKYDEYINDLCVKILSIDYDLNEDLIEEFNIQKLPTLYIYHTGNFICKIEGFMSKTEFINKLTSMDMIV